MADEIFPEMDLNWETERPEDIAASWAAYLHSGEAAADGYDRFLRWLDHSTAHVQAYKRAEQIWRDLDMADIEHAFATLPLTDQIETPDADMPPISLEMVRGAKRRRGWLPARAKWWAASVALAASLILGIGLWRHQNEVSVGESIEIASVAGHNRQVLLPDGSRITLRPASRLIARLSPTARQIELRQGGAFFEVAQDSTRPFIVRTFATQIQVVGTRFDVMRWPGGVTVSVAKGVVDVGKIDRAPVSTSKWRRSPGLRITAAQQVTASVDGGLGQVQAFDPASDLAWRTGWLTFRDTPLARMLVIINPYRHAKIQLADPSLGKTRLTASFRYDDTDKLLGALEAGGTVRIERTPEQVVIRAALPADQKIK